MGLVVPHLNHLKTRVVIYYDFLFHFLHVNKQEQKYIKTKDYLGLPFLLSPSNKAKKKIKKMIINKNKKLVESIYSL